MVKLLKESNSMNGRGFKSMKTSGHANNLPSDTPTPQDQKSPLLHLPTETLFSICTYASLYHGPIQPMRPFHGAQKFFHEEIAQKSTMRSALTGHALSRTCVLLRKICNNGLLFYQINKFHFRTMIHMINFLKTVGNEKKQAIQHVSIVYSLYNSPLTAFKALSTCHNLKTVELEISGLFREISDYDEKYLWNTSKGDEMLEVGVLEGFHFTWPPDFLSRVLARRGYGPDKQMVIDLERRIREIEKRIGNRMKESQELAADLRWLESEESQGPATGENFD